MPVRLKKFIGMILLVLLVIVYALVAVTIAATKLADAGGFVHFLYFLFTGLLWVLPAMLLVRWMEKKPKPRN
jgi:hypothetical protein